MFRLFEYLYPFVVELVFWFSPSAVQNNTQNPCFTEFNDTLDEIIICETCFALEADKREPIAVARYGMTVLKTLKLSKFWMNDL